MKKILLICCLIFLFSACKNNSRYEIFESNYSDSVYITYAPYSKKAPNLLSRFSISERSADNITFLTRRLGCSYNGIGYSKATHSQINNKPYFDNSKFIESPYYNKFLKSNLTYQFSISDTQFSNVDIRPYIWNIFPLELVTMTFELPDPEYINIKSPLLHYKYNNISFNGNIHALEMQSFITESDTNNYNLLISNGKDTEYCTYIFSPEIYYGGYIKILNEHNFILSLEIRRSVWFFINNEYFALDPRDNKSFYDITIDYAGHILNITSTY